MEPPKRKKRKLNNDNDNEFTPEPITSLSDDENEEEKEDKLTLLSEEQKEQLESNGYCTLNNDPMQKQKIEHAVTGYVRNKFNEKCMITALIRCIINFYSSQYNVELYVEVICTDNTKNDKVPIFLVPKINLSLSNLLSNTDNAITIDAKKVNVESMHTILEYLGHHKGVSPAPIPKPIRSTEMKNIVTDEWDAHFIDALTKKQVFEVITSANYLGCASLVHLGCAKIATLIKGKSPSQIRDLLAD